MKFEIDPDKLKNSHKAILCIAIGTIIGLVVYQIFLYFKLAIFGWNIGLAIAPLVAGYAETILARKILGEDIGAISAFVIFAYTTFYSFILKNPSLGMNFITAGSVFVILLSAFPTLINYLIITIGFGIILYFVGIFKKITELIYGELKKFYYKIILRKEPEVKIKKEYIYDELKNNEILNNLDFYYITSTDVEKRIINLGQFHATEIIEKAAVRSPPNPQEFEKETLYHIKNGKDKCLKRLVENVKAAGGNGIIDLDIQYGMVGLGGDCYQVTALGMGVYLS
jgi:hypothetical protein